MRREKSRRFLPSIRISLDSIIIDINSNIMENIIEQLDSAIGENLRRLRLAQGMTLDALGDASGVSRAMISRIERGETSPTAQLLARICAALGTSLSAFCRCGSPCLSLAHA